MDCLFNCPSPVILSCYCWWAIHNSCALNYSTPQLLTLHHSATVHLCLSLRACPLGGDEMSWRQLRAENLKFKSQALRASQVGWHLSRVKIDRRLISKQFGRRLLWEGHHQGLWIIIITGTPSKIDYGQVDTGGWVDRTRRRGEVLSKFSHSHPDRRTRRNSVKPP